MRVMIEGLRSIGMADFDIADTGQTLVCGLNGVGKSTVCTAIAAALTGVASPITAKGRGNDADWLVADGSKSGRVSVSGADGSASIEWPSGKHETRGTAPRASVIATGVRVFTSGTDEQRARLFADVFKATPTPEEIRRALLPLYAGENPSDKQVEDAEPSIAGVLARIEAEGWDAAAKAFAESAKLSKGRWCEVTGRAKWGADIAATWVPAGLRPDVPEADLEAEVKAAQAAHEASVAASAVAGDRLQQLEATAATVQAKAKALADAEQAAKQANANLLSFNRDRQARAANSVATGVTCPHCDEPVWIVGTTLAKHEPAPPSQESLAMFADATTQAMEQNTAAAGKLTTARAEFNAASKAVTELKELRAKGAPAAGAHPVDKAKAALDSATAALEAYRKLTRATEIADSINGALAVKELLDPEGMRRRKSLEVLDGVNSMLAELSAAARTLPVSIDSEMGVRWNNRPYAALSRAQRFRCDAIVRLLIARHDGSSLVIFDDADTLDQDGRRGLTEMLLKHWKGRPAVIGMTISARDKAPPMHKVGGVALWIEAGRVTPAHAGA